MASVHGFPARRCARHLRTQLNLVRIFLLVLAVSAALTALIIAIMRQSYADLISMHGWIALGLGVFFSFALGGGLMALVFISARRGYDDRIEMDPGDEH